jgi:hypothetical protein
MEIRLAGNIDLFQEFPEAQIRNFNFPELTSALEGIADY